MRGLNTSRAVAFFLVCGVGLTNETHAQHTTQVQREAMYQRYFDFASYVKDGSIEPHWMADGSSFWYAEGEPENVVIWKVDPVADTKTPLFDVERLRRALAAELGHEPPHRGVPFREFTFRNGEAQAEFELEEQRFVLRFADYDLSPRPEERQMLPEGAHLVSPAGEWAAVIRDRNLWFVPLAGGEPIQVTTDGALDYNYILDGASWSPDGSVLALLKADTRHLVRNEPIILNWLQQTRRIFWGVDWAEPGPRTRFEVVLARRTDGLVPVRLPEDGQSLGAAAQFVPILGWNPDGSTVYFLRTEPLYQRTGQLIAADAKTGTAMVLLSEDGPLSVFSAWESWIPRPLHFLADGSRFIWKSDRDGWDHLYLYDRDGNLIRRLTTGAFPVVRVVAVDEAEGWVYFTARVDRQRPYDSHLCRVRLDATGFQRLTPSPGEHDVPVLAPWLRGAQTSIQVSPSKQYFVTTHSTPSRPPVTELRRVDGRLVRVLSQTSMEALHGLRWRPPEEFVVKAADGETDIYGILYRPFDFDPNSKYPVVEVIHASPDRSIVPTTFTSNNWGVLAQALAQLGFVTVIIEGRGTGWRGKRFRNAIDGRAGRVEIQDHVAALKQLASVRSYMDMTRVGIVGSSYGGYHAIRAMLLAPDVYRVGVASAPMATSPGPRYLGPPEENEEGYRYASNLNFADRLEGRLLLMHGTADRAVPLSVTLRFIEALIQANKPYDLVLMPDGDHVTLTGGAYWREALRRYLQQHLNS